MAEIGEILSWGEGRRNFARAVPNDGRKSRTFGPYSTRDMAETKAERYLHKEDI